MSARYKPRIAILPEMIVPVPELAAPFVLVEVLVWVGGVEQGFWRTVVYGAAWPGP